MHNGIRKFSSTKPPIFKLEDYNERIDLDVDMSDDRHEIRMSVIPDNHKANTKCFECRERGEVYLSELQTNRICVCCSSLECIVKTTNYLSKEVI